MTALLKLYMVSIGAFLLLDAMWLELVARNSFRARMGELLLGGRLR